MRFADNTGATVRTVARLRSDRDVHVLAECGQEAHQALAGKIRQPSNTPAVGFRQNTNDINDPSAIRRDTGFGGCALYL